jgi:hypothetical protein
MECPSPQPGHDPKPIILKIQNEKPLSTEKGVNKKMSAANQIKLSAIRQ